MNSPHGFRDVVQPGRWLRLTGVAALVMAGALETRAADGKVFASPEEAVQALSVAVNQRDTNALVEIFGPALAEIRSADRVQSQNELAAFAARLNASNHLSRIDDSRFVLETGEDRWPFPIPIVRQGNSWTFDTQAGKEEILNRRIGQNELQALRSLRACAQGQREYATADRDGDDVREYAQKFVSSPGTKDGLYWPPDLDGDISPLGPTLVAAQAEGYLKSVSADGKPRPFHGYYFKILTRQGKHAAGGEYNYIINKNMIVGFAFIAWPAQYGTTGVMTFIINQRGRVYQKDLGRETESAVKKLKGYDPDPSWTLSPD